MADPVTEDNGLTGTKSKWLSKGWWGGIITTIVSILGIFGYTVAPEVLAEINNLVILIITAVSGGIAAYGRLVATSKVE